MNYFIRVFPVATCSVRYVELIDHKIHKARAWLADSCGRASRAEVYMYMHT
jgi:hypothetical protein